MAEDELGLVGVDVRHGMPRSVLQENAARDDGMEMRIELERTSEGLDDSDHAGASVGLIDGGGHHLADGLVGESGELSEKLSMEEKIGPEHSGQRKNPLVSNLNSLTVGSQA